MCGIVGLVEFGGRTASQRDVVAMSAQLRHRGPDGYGAHIEGPVALGHRRLSIIDLASGAQPMANEDARVWITYNGELYNFRELRDELEKAGHSFRTLSDTEVIVHAWEQWGERCVERFRGMFAFAIADYRRRVLFLARDHLGIKPLYYFQTRERLVFASEMQALQVHSDCPRELDAKAIDDYLFLYSIPPPRTIYNDVHKLAPATRMTIGFDGHGRGPEQYWKLKFRPENGVAFAEWKNGLDHVLRHSVQAHLVADVPFGAFLSGGIDSTAVVALMSEQLGAPVRTFSIGFEEEDFSELEYARRVAKRFSTDHHEEIVRPDAAAILPDLVRHYGEPYGDSSAIPTYYVSRLARCHVSVALTGDGGDEAFLGYDRYLGWHDWINMNVPHRAAWKRVLRPILATILPQRFPKRRVVRPHDWLNSITAVSGPMREALWRPEFAQHVASRVDEIEDVLQDADEVCAEQFGQYIDYRTYLPHDVLTKVDIASMCHGLECRTPLTDIRVAEFAATIPWTINLRRNSDGVLSGKHILKSIVRDYFDDDFVERKKTGFGVPLKHWFARGGTLRKELIERFSPSDARIYRYFRSDTVGSLIDTHGMGRCDHSQVLWQLLFLESWLEHAHDWKGQDHEAESFV